MTGIEPRSLAWHSTITMITPPTPIISHVDFSQNNIQVKSTVLIIVLHIYFQARDRVLASAPVCEVNPRDQLLHAIKSNPQLRPTPGNIGLLIVIMVICSCPKSATSRSDAMSYDQWNNFQTKDKIPTSPGNTFAVVYFPCYCAHVIFVICWTFSIFLIFIPLSKQNKETCTPMLPWSQHSVISWIKMLFVWFPVETSQPDLTNGDEVTSKRKIIKPDFNFFMSDEVTLILIGCLNIKLSRNHVIFS